MDRSAGALSEHLEARSELLLFTRLELAAAQGTVGKLSTSAFRWCRQREPSEVSPAISTVMDHVCKIVFLGKIPKLTDTPRQEEFFKVLEYLAKRARVEIFVNI